MIKGCPGYVAGCYGIDHRHANWCASAMDRFDARLPKVKPSIPFEANEFEVAIFSSIFSHLNEAD